MCAGGQNSAASLRSFCRGEPVVKQEGGVAFVILPGLRFICEGTQQEINGLLVPQEVPALGGYSTRLLLEQRPPKPALNWTTVQALGRSWHAWSWNGVPSNWSWREILASHLKVLA